MSTVAFSAPAHYQIGPNPHSVVVGDFNGDGKLDMAVTSGNSVSVLLGNGDGSFQPAKPFNSGGQAVSVSVGDFNGDGKLDLAVANEYSNTFGTGNVSVLLGDGDGTFAAPETYATGDTPWSVAVADFNGDGKLDLAVANLVSNNVSILLGNGDGSFQAAQNVFAGVNAGYVAVGDFNGDGKPDLVVADGPYNTVNVLLGNGDGTFQTSQAVYSGGAGPDAVVIGDFNGDGKPDLAVANTNHDISVLLGNGDGTFQNANYLYVNFDPGSMVIGDFNGDGKPDLAVANTWEAGGGNNVAVLLGHGDGTFETSQSLAAGILPVAVASGDFNGDGKPDLAVANGGDTTASVLLNQLGTITTVSGPASSTYGQSVTYTASVTSGILPVTGGTITFLFQGYFGNNATSPPVVVNANGQATFTIATLNASPYTFFPYTVTASYSGTPDGAGTTGFGASAANTSLSVNPAVLSASAVNFQATAGAPWSGTVATFVNPDPFGGAASYTARIAWGDGSYSNGIITGTGKLLVGGVHTYADSGMDAVSVQISHNLGNTTTATVYPTAAVSSLGQQVQHRLTGGIGFWHNKNGQALINGFNGGANAKALSAWLATSFGNLYGAGAGGNNLTGFTNAQVAAFYQTQFAMPGPKVTAMVLGTALNVYATTQSLGGTTGEAYGFSISADGLGADSFNVGGAGAAFGVANNSTRNVYELLQAVNQQAYYGVLYYGDQTLQADANHLFDALDTAGAI